MTRRALAILTVTAVCVPAIGQKVDEKQVAKGDKAVKAQNPNELRGTAKKLMVKIKALYEAGKKKEATALLAKARALYKAANQLDKLADKNRARNPERNGIERRGFEKFYSQRNKLRKAVTEAAEFLRDLKATANELRAEGKKAEADKMKARIQAAQNKLDALTKEVFAAQKGATYRALGDLPTQKYADAELDNARKVLLKRAQTAEKEGHTDIAKQLRDSAKLLGKKSYKFNTKDATKQANDVADTPKNLEGEPRKTLEPVRKPRKVVKNARKVRRVQQGLSKRLSKATKAKAKKGSSYFDKKAFAKRQDEIRARFRAAQARLKKSQANGDSASSVKSTAKASSFAKKVTRQAKVDERIRHLLNAAENLTAAGFREKARELIEQAEQLRATGKATAKPKRSAKDQKEIDELRGTVKRLNNKVDRLTNLLEKLLKEKTKK